MPPGCGEEARRAEEAVGWRRYRALPLSYQKSLEGIPEIHRRLPQRLLALSKLLAGGRLEQRFARGPESVRRQEGGSETQSERQAFVAASRAQKSTSIGYYRLRRVRL